MISEFAKEKVFWTRKMNLKLVKFIENRPNIWNPNHPKYTSVEYRDQTYSTFASKYGNEFTGQAVKDRWTNIRSTFANYLRKLKASRAKEDGEVYKVNWHLWEPCSFLLNVNRSCQKRIAQSNKRNKLGKSITEYADDENKEDVKTKTEEVSSNDDDYSDKSPIGVNSTCQNIANGILNVFRGVQNDIFNVDNTEYGNLGNTIANKLSEMSSYEAAQVTSNIMNILLQYHEDNPYNPNNIKAEDL